MAWTTLPNRKPLTETTHDTVLYAVLQRLEKDWRRSVVPPEELLPVLEAQIAPSLLRVC